MKPEMCSRCGKNVAVVFVTKIENDTSTSQGICLKCAKELGIKPVDDLMRKMGISDDDLDSISEEMMSAFSDMGIGGMPEDSDEDDSEGKTATFPFLDQFLNNSSSAQNSEMGQRTKSEEKADAQKDGKRKFLNSYCISLTQKGADGKIDQIVGRDMEIARLVQILNRRQKNNPCLIGEPGVGKTAIAEGLAMRMIEGNVPVKLRDKELYLLDLTALVAGTQFRGQFESRMKGLIDEIKKLGNIILVIDEVHNIVGAGDAEGSMNAANILKPALSRGEIQVIGATTLTEYRKHIEKDSALERRFQPIIVVEPSIDESIEIIKGIKHYYEDFHNVDIPDTIAALSVTLSERYITDRFLPDKAIDLIDEACSDVNLKDVNFIEIADIKKKLDVINEERDMLMPNTTEESYARMAELRALECQLEEHLAKLTELPRPKLTIENLARVIELWTKIPASSISEVEFERLSKLSARLKSRIVGQDEAIDTLCAAIKRSRVGISPKFKPASFIFVGPTGVGKTELVKCLASDLFDSPEALIRLDMSEFMEKHSVSRIIGSPPGYVGYDEAGQLTEKIRRKPYAVVLFDEIEKAHPDVLNILLQILDDGHITDAQGRNINFENTVIVMTSNAGSQNKEGSMGFGKSVTELGKEKALKALNDFLRPEFINRIDEVIAFNQLPKEHFVEIAKIMLGDLEKALQTRGVKFTYEEGVPVYLADKSFSVKYGARNLRRQITKDIEDKISNIIIDKYHKMPETLHVKVENGEIIVE